MKQKRLRSADTFRACILIFFGTAANLYWGWVRERRCAADVRALYGELLSKRDEARLPCPEIECPACPPVSDTVVEADASAVAVALSPASDNRRRLIVPCPLNCTGGPTRQPRGTCSEANGVCVCREPFAGKGCELRKTSDVSDSITVLLPTEAAGGTGNRIKWIKSLRKRHPQMQVIAWADDDLQSLADPLTTLVDQSSSAPLGAQLDTLLDKASSDLVFVAVDSKQIGAETNFTMAMDMLQSTSVDILGGLTEAPDRLLSIPCWEIVHKRWLLRYRRAPFGYRRHERFVMYCDRTSRMFVAKRSALLSIGGFTRNLGGMAVADVFVRVHEANAGLLYAARNASLSSFNTQQLAAAAPTRLPGWIMVGTASEIIFPSTDRITEVFDPTFAERHQVEAYFAPDGPMQGPICIKTGGNLQHSVEGKYSPLCHRYTRQRDFTHIHDLWTDASWAKPAVKGAAEFRYAVSVHHGNLFGAMRMGEELLWETDGDFDLIGFNLTGEQLIARGAALTDLLKQEGFSVTAPHRKPTYLNVLRNKTDFQISLRSPKDPSTAGKPPHEHTLSVAYQGRRVFVNGFQNPFRGIRADKGHDYRDHYLAQQPWVLHFTKNSIGCKTGTWHNACLPSCMNPSWVLDHNFCSDDEIAANDRNPYLWGRTDAAWQRQLHSYY
ncbi:hypothetical protein DIPPA_31892 [Diplonema papillatum]|nr:hypothetical protein DIPPA_31892 [Diplonema papillatum]